MIKIIKIAVGSAAAILLADRLGLEYSTSAGIITLLTIQDTAKETIRISINRLLAFFIATLFSLTLFETLGYFSLTFGVFLLLFVGSCYFLKMKDAIAMNAVLTTHYLLSGDMTFALFTNELLLLVIGAGIGTLLNLYMPGDIKKIRSTQAILEADLKKLLLEMAHKITSGTQDSSYEEYFLTLEEHISSGVRHAYSNMNNRFLQETQYFVAYMEMRKQQFQVLESISHKISFLEYVPEQSKKVALFIQHISHSFSELNNAKALLEEGDQLFISFQNSPLPVTREEFEARAVLYMIMKDFAYFLKLKETFAKDYRSFSSVTPYKVTNFFKY